MYQEEKKLYTDEDSQNNGKWLKIRKYLLIFIILIPVVLLIYFVSPFSLMEGVERSYYVFSEKRIAQIEELFGLDLSESRIKKYEILDDGTDFLKIYNYGDCEKFMESYCRGNIENHWTNATNRDELGYQYTYNGNEFIAIFYCYIYDPDHEKCYAIISTENNS